MNHLETASEPQLQVFSVPLEDQDFNRTDGDRMLRVPSLTPSNCPHFNSACANLTVAFLASLSYWS